MIKRKSGLFTVHCNCCDRPTRKVNFTNAGDAAVQARNEGFITKSLSLESPCTWHCPNCKDKPAKIQPQVNFAFL